MKSHVKWFVHIEGHKIKMYGRRKMSKYLLFYMDMPKFLRLDQNCILLSNELESFFH